MASMRNKKNYPSVIIKYSSYLELCVHKTAAARDYAAVSDVFKTKLQSL